MQHLLNGYIRTKTQHAFKCFCQSHVCHCATKHLVAQVWVHADEQQKCEIAVLLIRFALHVHTLYNKQPNSKKTLVFLVGIKILEEN